VPSTAEDLYFIKRFHSTEFKFLANDAKYLRQENEQSVLNDLIRKTVGGMFISLIGVNVCICQT